MSIKEKQKQRELKEKAREFIKKYFAYDLAKKKLTKEIKLELENLGAHKPFYSDFNTERAILYIDMWKSNNQQIKDIVRQEAQKYFSMETDETDNFLYETLLKRREIAKSMRKKRSNC